jgi:hypothetical protein
MEASFQNFHINRISAVLSYKKSLSLATTSNRILELFLHLLGPKRSIGTRLRGYFMLSELVLSAQGVVMECSGSAQGVV